MYNYKSIKYEIDHNLHQSNFKGKESSASVKRETRLDIFMDISTVNTSFEYKAKYSPEICSIVKWYQKFMSMGKLKCYVFLM